MKILVVGAGAVGQTYGHHLAKGGAELTYFVRPKYLAECEAGLTVHRMGRDGEPLRGRFVADPERIEPVDQVWLTVSSPALRGDWLDPILARAGEAVLVMLQPGLEDRAYLAAKWPEDRIVAGLINLVAFQGPLPGETMPVAGVVYWFPPLSSSPFEGPRAREVAEALKAGGCPAAVRDDVRQRTLFGSAFLLPHMAALEVAGWRFAALRGELLRLAGAASREAAGIAAKVAGVERAFVSGFARPFFTCPASYLAPALAPFDLEVYLKYHFTKVGDQTSAALATYRRNAEKHGLAVPNIEELATRLEAAR